jgi:hypothetical protein
MPKLNFAPEIDAAVDEYSQLPPGWYRGHLMHSYFKPFNKGGGVSLVFELSVDYNGRPRKVMQFNTWENESSPEAKKWGHVAIKKFFRACGNPKAESTEECHNVPVEIRLEQGERFNNVKEYRRIGVKIPTENMVQEDVVARNAEAFDDDDIPF